MLNWDFDTDDQLPSMLNGDTDKQVPSMLDRDLDADKQVPSMLNREIDTDKQVPSMLNRDLDTDKQVQSMLNRELAVDNVESPSTRLYLSPTELEAEAQLLFSDQWDAVPDYTAQIQSRPSTSEDQLLPVSVPDNTNTEPCICIAREHSHSDNEPLVIGDEEMDIYEIDDFDGSFEDKNEMNRIYADVDLLIQQSPDSSSSDELPPVDWTGELSQNTQSSKAKSRGRWRPVTDEHASVNAFDGASTSYAQANSNANVKSLPTSHSTLQPISERPHTSDPPHKSSHHHCNKSHGDIQMETSQMAEHRESSSSSLAIPTCPVCNYKFPEW